MTTAIINVRLLDYAGLTELSQVVIEDGFISGKTDASVVVDGRGGTLLPGFIDSHVHLDGVGDLEEAARYGVTTMCDMAARSQQHVDNLKSYTNLCNIRTCYGAALYPIPDAALFVAKQVACGADYIKLIIEDPPVMAPKALSSSDVEALVAAARTQNIKTVAHAATVAAYRTAIAAGVDIITHVPIEALLPQEAVEEMARNGTVVIPTMVMMNGIVNSDRYRAVGFALDNVERNVQQFMEAGIPILAGTDANHSDYAPANIDHGKGLHDELSLFVRAGMSPLQALHSATNLAARVFGFEDRGTIAVGRRADLILVEGDPSVDIHVTEAIRGVWVAGAQIR